MFSGCVITLDLGTVAKEKLVIQKAIIENGGVVSYIVTQKVSFFTHVFFICRFLPCLETIYINESTSADTCTNIFSYKMITI